MRNKAQRGFTLIELLVVIAIIGILASVVLASLNSARQKGSDAAIKSNINSARAQAELFYDIGNTYAGVCSAGTNSINPMWVATDNAAGGAGFADCDSSATAWRLKGRLVSNTGQYYCADSTGYAGVVTAAYSDAGTDTDCP